MLAGRLWRATWCRALLSGLQRRTIMMSNRNLVAARAVMSMLTLIGLACATNCPAAEAEKPQSKWVDVSDGVLKKIEAEGKKTDWPGGTAGVAVDPANG